MAETWRREERTDDCPHCNAPRRPRSARVQGEVVRLICMRGHTFEVRGGWADPGDNDG